MTFQDLDKIPGLSRPWKMCLSNSMTFHDFPGPVATLYRSSSVNTVKIWHHSHGQKPLKPKTKEKNANCCKSLFTKGVQMWP